MKGTGRLIGVLALSAAAGCTTTTVETFYAVQNPDIDQAFVKPGTDWSTYDALLQAGPLNIVYVEGNEEPDPADLARIRSSFREAFYGAIADDYEVVDAPGPNVLAVRADLIDLKINDPGLQALPFNSRLRSLVAKGQLTFIMELRDSQTGEVLARAADQEKPDGSSAGESSWDEVEASAQRWASLFRKFLDENLGQK